MIDEGESATIVAANDLTEATPEKAREAGRTAVTPQEAAPPIKSPKEREQIDKSHYAEATLTKKITVFAVTTVLVLIALGLIYAYLPLGIVK